MATLIMKMLHGATIPWTKRKDYSVNKKRQWK